MASDRTPGILHLIHSLQGGGTERTLVALLRNFDPTLLAHRVVTQRDAGSLTRHLPDHVSCIPLYSPARCRKAGWQLARVARRTRAAAIHARNTGTWFDAIVACCLVPGILPVLGFHGLDGGTSFTRRQRCVARLGRCLGARFASVSARGRDQLVREAGIPAERIDLLPNGVDTDRYVPVSDTRRAEIRRHLNIPPKAVVVGTVGSQTWVKRHDLLLDAIASIVPTNANIRLMLVGDGPLADANRLYARQAGIADRVYHMGNCDDVRPLLSSMDIFVNCSDGEGMSNALLEALATGVPVVVTDVGDNGSIVRDGIDGTVVRPSSAVILSNAIAALVSSEVKRISMRCAARSRAEQFSFGAVVTRYEQWYQSLVAGKTLQSEPAYVPGTAT